MWIFAGDGHLSCALTAIRLQCYFRPTCVVSGLDRADREDHPRRFRDAKRSLREDFVHDYWAQVFCVKGRFDSLWSAHWRRALLVRGGDFHVPTEVDVPFVLAAPCSRCSSTIPPNRLNTFGATLSSTDSKHPTDTNSRRLLHRSLHLHLELAGELDIPDNSHSLPRLAMSKRRTWRRCELCTPEVLMACCVCLCHQTHPMTFTFGSLSVHSRLS